MHPASLWVVDWSGGCSGFCPGVLCVGRAGVTVARSAPAGCKIAAPAPVQSVRATRGRRVLFPIAGYTSAVASQGAPGSGLLPVPTITAACCLQVRSSSVQTPLQVH